MTVEVRQQQLFHVALPNLTYNNLPPLEVGGTYAIGQNLNPYSNYFEQPIGYVGRFGWLGNKVELSRVPTYLEKVAEGQYQMPARRKLAVEAAEIARTTFKALREVLYERERLIHAPNSPSRQTCLFCAQTIDHAVYWRDLLTSGESRVLELSATGTMHAANLMFLADELLPLTTMRLMARAYWQDGQTALPEAAPPEILFQGDVTVLRIVEL